MLDIAYLRALRDVFIEEGQTGVHHLLNESGWTTFYIEDPDDYDHAQRLVRFSYLYHINVFKKTPGGAEEYAAVDLESELDDLNPTDAVRPAFERRRPGKVGPRTVTAGRGILASGLAPTGDIDAERLELDTLLGEVQCLGGEAVVVVG